MKLEKIKEAVTSFIQKNSIVIILFCITIVLELLFSNSPVELFAGAEESEVDLSELSLSSFMIDEPEVIFDSGNLSCIYTPENPIKTTNVYLEFEGVNKSYVSGEIRIKDESRKEQYKTLGYFSFNPAGVNEVCVPVKSSGDMTQMEIALTGGVNGSIALKNMTLNKHQSLQFNRLRWLLMVAFLAIVVAVKRLGIWNKYYDAKNKKHIAASVAMAVINICIAIFISVNIQAEYDKDVKYPLESSIDSYSLLVKQFDAFQKGQFWLDTDLSEEDLNKLAEMENPYDNSSAALQLGEYMYYRVVWDHAYYDGKLYSYFGVAPILTVYYPYYLITGKLPVNSTVGMVFSILFVIFSVLLIRKVISCFKLRVNVIVALLTMLGLPSVSYLFMLQSCSDVYYLAYASVYAFIVAFLYASVSAYNDRKKLSGIVWYFVSGVFLVLAVASRPTTVVPAFLMVLPLYLHVLFEKKNKVGQKIKLVAGFAVPVCAGAIALMWYNAQRFSSPFDFGITWQLTVSDVHYNKLDFSMARFWSYINHYWLHLLDLRETFPFINFSWMDCLSDGRYIWHEHSLMLSVFSMPINVLLFAIPWYIKKKPLYIKGIILGGFFGSFLILYVNYCLGGIHIRYVCDGILVLVMLSFLILWKMVNYLRKKHMYAVRTALMVCLGLSIVLGGLLIFNNERNFLMNNSPDTYIQISRFLSIK